MTETIGSVERHIADVLENFPGAKRWCSFNRNSGRSIGLFVYDMDVRREGPIYILEIPYQRLGFIMVMPDDREAVELIMTDAEFKIFIESGGKTLPPGFVVDKDG